MMHHRRYFGVVLGLVSVVSLFGITAQAQGLERTTSKTAAGNSTLKPDYAYFKGKTITLMANGTVGAGADLLFTTIQPGLSAALGANVVVEDLPGGGGLQGEDAAGDAAPNGLTIGYLPMSGIISAQAQNLDNLNVTTVNFPVKDVEVVGGIHSLEALIISNTKSGGPQTIQDLLDSTSPTRILQTNGSSFSIFVQMLIAAYHAVPLSIVYGYASSGALVEGFERGDSNVTGTSLVTLAPLITGGATPLLLDHPLSPGVPLYGQLKADKVPDLETLIKEDPPKSKAGIAVLKALTAFESGGATWMFVPRHTPAARVLALSDAIKKVFASPTVEAEIEAGGSPPGLVPASSGKKSILAGLATEKTLSKFLK